MTLSSKQVNLIIAGVIVSLSFVAIYFLRLQSAPSQESIVFYRSLSDKNYQNVPRGGDMATSSGDYVEYIFPDDARIFLDQNTVVRLDATSPTNSVTLIQGRIIVRHGSVLVKARNLSLSTSDCVLVHYSWLDYLDVAPLSDGGCAFSEGVPNILHGLTTKFSTFDKTLKGVSNFVPQNSGAKEFYNWSGIMTAQPSAPVEEL